MNGLAEWVLNQLGTRYPQQFKAATGMTVQEVHSAYKKGDKKALQRVRAYGEQVQQSNPSMCSKAQEWAQTTFPGMVPGENKTNPTTIERTQ